MKKKLTLTIDAELLPLAKRYAQSQGLSLSSLVEGSSRELAAPNTPLFTSRWRGRLKAADAKDDSRYDVLARKYLQ